MNTGISPSEQKLRSIMRYAPIGLLEIQENGAIVNINILGEKLLLPLLPDEVKEGGNLFPVLDVIDSGISQQVKGFTEPSGLIIFNKVYHFTHPDTTEKDYKFTITKMFADCIIVSLEDLTEKIAEERAFKQAEQDKAVAQGKYELAAEVLHDIGNAVVGFGSYLTRTNRSMDNTNQTNLNNVIMFLKQQQQVIGGAIGEQKAVALVNLIEGIAQSQKSAEDEMRKSITEQLRIVSHIQDILNIQRQYLMGHASQDRKPVNLKEVIHDCEAMVLANLEKKGITLSVSLPTEAVYVKGDRTKLMQVILNLLKNSIEAIGFEAEKKQITMRLFEADNKVQLTLTDTGTGFDEEVGKHLFERGYTTKNTGSGLGLYNCRSIIESHSGQIEMTSNGPGTGTSTFIEFIK
ncbi:HAMP domain-containing histidine kinase [Mucilaginibacter limnophilus]|uniref:histidine kinase n=1 Tax=Mucilaginibacter limnophilus TaxID=1932778 RepID=A0A3S2UP23_9SPHI|nr:HAMP domain-containing sensor histidine kinase [Mucilaginibacter limnophilus]RVU02497.1 HAMP domain-containing histidine kinase [Mucilaginibacter limnophilus]